MTRWERFRRLLRDGPYWREIEAMRQSTAAIDRATAMIEANNECLRAKLQASLGYEVKVYGPGFDEGLPDAVTKRLSFPRDLW